MRSRKLRAQYTAALIPFVQGVPKTHRIGRSAANKFRPDARERRASGSCFELQEGSKTRCPPLSDESSLSDSTKIIHTAFSYSAFRARNLSEDRETSNARGSTTLCRQKYPRCAKCISIMHALSVFLVRRMLLALRNGSAFLRYVTSHYGQRAPHSRGPVPLRANTRNALG